MPSENIFGILISPNADVAANAESAAIKERMCCFMICLKRVGRKTPMCVVVDTPPALPAPRGLLFYFENGYAGRPASSKSDTSGFAQFL